MIIKEKEKINDILCRAVSLQLLYFYWLEINHRLGTGDIQNLNYYTTIKGTLKDQSENSSELISLNSSSPLISNLPHLLISTSI